MRLSISWEMSAAHSCFFVLSCAVIVVGWWRLTKNASTCVHSIFTVAEHSGKSRPQTKNSLRSCLCITFISCARRDYMNVSLTRLMDFVDKFEPGLCYELNWIDQAMAGRDEFARRFKFHRRALFWKAQGYPLAFTLAFLLCPHDFIFLMEEDWLLNDKVAQPFLSLAMDLLNSGPRELYGILLRDLPLPTAVRPCDIRTENFGAYRVWMFMNQVHHFNNGATVYRMWNIRNMLQQGPYTGELEFGHIARKLGYHFGFYVEPPSKDKPGRTHGFFTHIGLSSTRHSNVCRDSISFS